MSLQRAIDVLEEENQAEYTDFPCNVHALFIQPPDDEGMISGEDDVDGDSHGTLDSVCVAQLKASCELAYEDGRRMQFDDNDGDVDETPDESQINDEQVLADILNAPLVFVDEANYEEPSSSSATPRKRLCRVQSLASPVEMPNTNKNTKFVWIKETGVSTIPIFSEANYEDCRDLKSYEQFEKFFDDDLLQHICDCSALYATFRGRVNPKITIAGNICHHLCCFVLFCAVFLCSIRLQR